MGAEDRARYFTQDASHWLLKREYRSMVRFARQNILDLLSSAPPLEWSGFDLILCRNVLIYFSPGQALDLVAALRGSLAPDGALLLGHAEATLTSGVYLGQVGAGPLPTEFAQAVRPPVQKAAAYFPPVVPPMPWPLMREPAPAPASVAEPAPAVDDIQLLADAGAYEAAERLCAERLLQEPTSARLHYYSAILHQVSDDLLRAEASLRRALYLDRSFIAAHHRLGMLLLSQGRNAEARRSLQAAQRLADAQPADAPLPEGRGVLTGELGAAARSQRGKMDVAA
jgi:chemotaxis protein methyltransferase CheR